MLHTLRGLLYVMAAVIFVGMLALGGMAIHAARNGAAQLEAVNTRAVAPLTLLQSVERRVKEVRFRIAGVALEQLPTVGSANHLKEVQAALPAEWANFYAMASQEALTQDERALLDKANGGMGELESLMVTLQAAYGNDDMDGIKRLLEDDWPRVHGHLIKPLEQLMPHYQTAAQAQFDQAASATNRLTLLVSALFAGVIGVVGMATWIFQRRLNSQLTAASLAVNAVSRFDLSTEIRPTGQDEIGQLLRALGDMQAHLREVVSQVRDGALSLERMSGELAGASDSVARASETQAESAANMAASMEQLSVSIDQMSEHAHQSALLAVRSGESSREGRAISQNAAREMSAIAEGARQSANIVSELGSLSTEISGIVNVIKEIADQTNLLALNAAIEAARAGEQGRGFAVVADEVRKLAERTTASTQQIGDMITRIQQGTQRAVEAMEADVARAARGEELANQTGGSMDQIEQRASEVARSVNEIQNALAEQSQAARAVAARVEDIARMTETSSNASRESSAHASEVSALAASLNQFMAGFRL